MLRLKSDSPQRTQEFGRHLGNALSEGAVILLNGHLGAGKTHFIQGLASGLGVRERVVSPTFTIISEYEGRLPFVHMDLYRLQDVEQIEDLGIEEYFYGPQVCAIEWGLLAKELLPSELLTVEIERLESFGENERLVTIDADGNKYGDIVERMAGELDQYVYPGD